MSTTPARVELRSTSVLRPHGPADNATEQRRLGVTLVNMPFASPDRPSLAMGVLTAITRSAGHPVEAVNANLDFARTAGFFTGLVLSNHRGYQLGDWLFAQEAFGDAVPLCHDEFLEDFGPELELLSAELAGRLGHPVRADWLRRLRDVVVPQFLDELVASLDWSSSGVVGFTSTFQQTVAALALARRLRARHPDLTFVFGGANFEGEMGHELVRTSPLIDYAVVGEGDVAFPRLLRALALGHDPVGIPGVLARRGGAVVGVEPEAVHDLDRFPPPDYDDFFARSDRYGFLRHDSAMPFKLPFEASRGCWWGARSHCTFCGLNGSAIAHRAKSPTRVREELATLSRRYGSFRLEATDNIMPKEYITDLLPLLVEDEVDYEIFFELKASLGRSEVAALTRAGVRASVPGIESLSSHVLALMRKGTRAATNVNLLRWAAYYGMWVDWNILFGFPRETRADYESQAALMRTLHHLQPPRRVQRIWMERFSPVFTDREQYAVTYVAPERSYRYVFPADVQLERVAYFFEYEFEDALPDDAYDTCRDALGDWQAARASRLPSLELWRSGDMIRIVDERVEGASRSWTFSGVVASLYLAVFDHPRSLGDLVRRGESGGLDETDAEQILMAYVERGLMMRDGNLFLALALPHTPHR